MVADRDTLSHLLELAYAVDPESEHADAAAVVGWWAQRADHPGTGAVLDVVSACAARWVLGVPPVQERDIAVWRQWLGVVDRGPQGLLDMAGLISSAATCRAWRQWPKMIAPPGTRSPLASPIPTLRWDWRRRDSRREAALGLASRCDAVELYESLRLGDPLVATRESFAGTVVTGTITSLVSRSVEVTLDYCVIRPKTDRCFAGSRTRKTADAVQPKRLKTYSSFG